MKFFQPHISKSETSNAAEHSPTPGRFRTIRFAGSFRQVLECGCALPLSIETDNSHLSS